MRIAKLERLLQRAEKIVGEWNPDHELPKLAYIEVGGMWRNPIDSIDPRTFLDLMHRVSVAAAADDDEELHRLGRELRRLHEEAVAELRRSDRSGRLDPSP